MAGIAAAILGAGALGAGASIFGSMRQTSAAQSAIAAQQGMFNQAAGYAKPFISAGTQAAGTLSNLLKPGADMSSLLQTIPGFKFLQDITQQGVSNQGTVTGLGGNTLLRGAQAGNEIALSAGWNPIVNALQGLTSTGAGSAGALGGQAVQTGQGIGSNLVGIGNAQAAAGVSAGNSIGNSLTTAALFQKLLNQGGMYGPTGAAAFNTPGSGGAIY